MEANPDAINLAARLEDGEQLDVPYKAGYAPTSSSSAPFQVVSTQGPSSSNADLININTATLEKLDSLPGIGPTTAQKIIDYRAQHGPFQQIEEIMNVSGIGPATFDRIKDLITVE
jgi:competence protein ComEA